MKKTFFHILLFILIITAGQGCSWDIQNDWNPGILYPESQLKGWELDETNTGLRGNYTGLTEFTDVASAGYLQGPDGPLVITRPVTLEHRTIPWEIVVESAGVVINSCRIRPASVGMGMPLVSARSAIIRDSEIDGSLISDAGIVYSLAYSGTGIIEGCDIHHAASGIFINNEGPRVSVAQGNYIHDLRWISPAHMDGITTRASTGAGVILRNNRSICGSDQGSTGALFLQPFSGPIDNVLIEGNLLEGYGYNLGIDNHGSGYGYNLYIIDNRMNPAGFGPFAIDPAEGISLAAFHDNYIYDPGAEEGRGQPVLYR